MKESVKDPETTFNPAPPSELRLSRPAALGALAVPAGLALSAVVLGTGWAISTQAVALGVLGAASIVLASSLVGGLLSICGLRGIRRNPLRLRGQTWAVFGIVAASAVLGWELLLLAVAGYVVLAMESLPN